MKCSMSLGFVFITIIGIFVGGAYWLYQAKKVTQIVDDQLPFIKEISMSELKNILNKDDLVPLLNTLSPDVYQDCRIKSRGSVNFPFYLSGNELAQWKKAFLVAHPHALQQPIYVYCTSKECAAGQMACKVLQTIGFTKIFEYKGGMREWFDTFGKVGCDGACKAEYLYNEIKAH